MSEIIETLVSLWKFDVEVFSNPWMYWPLCIPAGCYLAFFFLKWVVLTAPVWLPAVIIIRSIKE